MDQKYILNLDSARRVAAAAEAEAEAVKNGWDVAIAIVDDGAHLMYLQREKVQLGSIETAIKKSQSSVDVSSLNPVLGRNGG